VLSAGFINVEFMKSLDGLYALTLFLKFLNFLFLSHVISGFLIPTSRGKNGSSKQPQHHSPGTALAAVNKADWESCKTPPHLVFGTSREHLNPGITEWPS
jgi:hypothetical protein